jgi:hypothetical protein
MATQNESDTWDPSALARMISLDPDTPPPSQRLGGAWSAHDLRVILRHQLATRLESDLGDLSEELREPAARAMTFANLLQLPQPPLSLLRRAKVFAKACKLDSDGPLPEEVATAIYFAVIAAALIRCGERISRLNDVALAAAMRWVLAKEWVDDMILELMKQSLAVLEPPIRQA